MAPAHQLAPLAVALLGAAASAGCRDPAHQAPARQEIIKIGVVGALTGANATYGISARHGIDLAVAELNAAGGRRFEAIHLDDLGEPEQAQTAAQRLITRDHVVALIGEATSSGALAMAPVAQRAHIPMITPSATHPAVTEHGDYVFRVCFVDQRQAQAMARFATAKLGMKRIAVLRDLDSDYARGLAAAFVAALSQEGGQVVVDEGYGARDTDFAEPLARIIAAAPDALYLPGYHTAVARIAAAARAAGLSIPLLGGDGWDAAELLEGSAGVLEGSHFTTHWHASAPGAATEGFVQRYRAAYNETPDGVAALGYDAVCVLADALKRAKTSAPAALRAAIASSDLDGVTGRTVFDEGGNANRQAVVLRIRDGAVEFVETVAP